MCVCVYTCLQACVCVYEGCTGGKDGPSVLLNPGQDFSLLGVYTTESSERGEIKIFNMLNLTLKIISILPVTQASPGLTSLTGLD